MSDTKYLLATTVKATECVIEVKPIKYDDFGNTTLLTDDELEAGTVCRDVKRTEYLMDFQVSYKKALRLIHTCEKRNAITFSSYADAYALAQRCNADSKLIHRVVIK